MIKNGQLPTKTLLIWILRVLFGFSLLISAFTGFKIYKAVYISVVIAGIVLIYLLLFFKGYKFEFRDTVFILEKGVIIKTTLIIPYKKIIHIKTLQSPLLKALRVYLPILKTVNGQVFLFENDKVFVECLFERIEEKIN